MAASQLAAPRQVVLVGLEGDTIIAGRFLPVFRRFVKPCQGDWHGRILRISSHRLQQHLTGEFCGGRFQASCSQVASEFGIARCQLMGSVQCFDASFPLAVFDQPFPHGVLNCSRVGIGIQRLLQSYSIRRHVSQIECNSGSQFKRGC